MKVPPSYLALLEDIIATLPVDQTQPTHYWLYRGRDWPKLSKEFRAAVQVRKDTLAVTLKEFAKHYGAYDVWSAWHPLSGLICEGLIYDSPIDVCHGLLNVESYHDVEYEGVKRVACKPNKHAKAGAKLFKALKTLQDAEASPLEFSDFVLSHFEIWRGMGTSVIRGERTPVIPPKVYDTALGLFISTPSDRLYEMPQSLEQVTATALSFASELDASIKRSRNTTGE